MSQSSERVKSWRKATKQRMVLAMGGKCQCCGYDRCVESLDFHHIDPAQKEKSLGAIRANPVAWGAIVNELKKCILVCRNCHGELHYGLRDLPETYARFDDRYSDYKSHEELSDPCPHCGTPKAVFRRYCSLRCGAIAQHAHPVDWTGFDLPELIKTKNAQEIADMIGVSRAAVYSRLRRAGIVVPDKKHGKRDRSYIPYVKIPKAVVPKISEIDPNWRHRPNLKIRKVNRPSREILERAVWEQSLVAVGKIYGVTDNAIRKWCQGYGITLPPQGYRQRREAGYSHEASLISQARPLKGKRVITKEIAEQAFALVKSGVSYRQAAAQFGFKHWGMQQAFERYGLEAIKHRVVPTDDVSV